MKLKAVLTVAAIYLGIVGIGLMFFPQRFGIGAVPENPPPALIAFLRVLSGPFLGIAVLNWLTRNAAPSAARDAVIIANLVGFASVAAMDVWGVFSGDARAAAKVFLVVHLLMTLSFVLAWRSRERHGSTP